MQPDTAVGSRHRSLGVLFDDAATSRIDVVGQIVRQHDHLDELRVRPVQVRDRLGTDPYGLADTLPGLAVDTAVLVAPRRRGTRGLLPGPVVAGVPVGIVQSGDVGDAMCRGRGPDPTAPWIVAAMAKNVFLDASDRWAARLGEHHATVDLRADRARRSDLVDALAAGPGVVLYAGHGSPRGWAGYQALRIDHVAEHTFGSRRPAGLVMAFACKTLARHRGRWPFGSHLVESGAALSYLAPAQSVATVDAEHLAEIVVDLLATAARPRLVAELMIAVDAAVADDPAARRAWSTFRLIGDPLTPIV